jgi:Fe-S-cluster containining protein
MTAFPCTRCGACCRNIGKLLATPVVGPQLEAVMAFPHAVLADGSCSKLGPDGCTVYATRPLLCNISDMHRKFYPELTQREFWNLNIAACRVLIVEQGLPTALQPEFV